MCAWVKRCKENNTESSASPSVGKQIYRPCSQGAQRWPPCFLCINMASHCGKCRSFPHAVLHSVAVEQEHCMYSMIRLCHRVCLVVCFPLQVCYELWSAQLRRSRGKRRILHVPTMKKVMSFFVVDGGFLPLYCSYVHGHSPPAEVPIFVYIFFHSLSLKRLKNTCRILVCTSLSLYRLG